MPAAPKAPKVTSIAEAVAEFAPATLAEALLAFQADPPKVVQDQEAEVKDKTGTKKLYTYKYLSLQALLAAMRPKLTELGLVWLTRPGIDPEGKPVVAYRCEHVASRESDEGVMPMVGAGGSMQALGGSFSFARRYATVIYFGLAPDVDEDAATAHSESAEAKTQGAAASRKITKARAEKILGQAKAANVLPRIQVAASKAAGFDVGPCDSVPKATAALKKLDGVAADKLEAWLEEKAAQLLDAQPAEPAEPGEQPQLGDEGEAA